MPHHIRARRCKGSSKQLEASLKVTFQQSGHDSDANKARQPTPVTSVALPGKYTETRRVGAVRKPGRPWCVRSQTVHNVDDVAAFHPAAQEVAAGNGFINSGLDTSWRQGPRNKVTSQLVSKAERGAVRA
ncbi:hypothetical protein HYQ46_013083 [Verticillium longisporum]|nr:hypothetical protein HYQ46_013083 [Verticillium longisporum]